MIIGFNKSTQTVSESDALPGNDVFTVFIDVDTLITSDRVHTMVFRVLVSSGTATVVPLDSVSGDYDAIFGITNGNNIEVRVDLEAGESVIQPLRVDIRNDFSAEDDECFTIRISPLDVAGVREQFMCNNSDSATSHFCTHIICIIDDDGMCQH